MREVMIKTLQMNYSYICFWSIDSCTSCCWSSTERHICLLITRK